MDEARFWEIISNMDWPHQPTRLAARKAALRLVATAEDASAFGELFERKRAELMDIYSRNVTDEQYHLSWYKLRAVCSYIIASGLTAFDEAMHEYKRVWDVCVRDDYARDEQDYETLLPICSDYRMLDKPTEFKKRAKKIAESNRLLVKAGPVFHDIADTACIVAMSMKKLYTVNGSVEEFMLTRDSALQAAARVSEYFANFDALMEKVGYSGNRSRSMLYRLRPNVARLYDEVDLYLVP